jgi:hypothetical protein
MEKKLGRYLKPEEVVHHIDFVRYNNNPENLYLFKNIKEHIECLKSIYNLIPYFLQNNLIEFRNKRYYRKEVYSSIVKSSPTETTPGCPTASDNSLNRGQINPKNALKQSKLSQHIENKEVMTKRRNK